MIISIAPFNYGIAPFNYNIKVAERINTAWLVISNIIG